MNAATKTKLPKGLPQAIRWEVARKHEDGNSVWVLENLDVPYNFKADQPNSRCQIWIMLYRIPTQRKLHCIQWERWDHGAHRTTLICTGRWDWNQDHAHKKWDELVEKQGYRRIV